MALDTTSLNLLITDFRALSQTTASRPNRSARYFSA